MSEKRFSYKLEDVNKVESMIPREILLDYDSDDLCIIDENGKPIGLRESMLVELSKSMQLHMKGDSQHNVVTQDLDGLMTSGMYESLMSCEKIVKSLEGKKILSEETLNVIHRNGLVDDIKCTYENNTITIEPFKIISSFDVISIGKSSISMYRPDASHVNKKGEKGISNTLCLLTINKFNGMKLVLQETTIDYKSGYTGGEKIGEGIYNVNGDIVIPMFLIRLRNSQDFSYTNRTSVSSVNRVDQEIIPMYSKLYNTDLSKILFDCANNIQSIFDYSGSVEHKFNSYGVKRLNDVTSAIVNKEFKFSDKDMLNKQCSLKQGLGSTVLHKAKSTGDFIAIKDRMGVMFTLEFFIDGQETYVNEPIIKITDTMGKDVVVVSVVNNQISVSGIGDIISCSVESDTVNYFRLTVDGDGIFKVHRNGKDIISNALDKYVENMHNFSICALNSPLSVVRLCNAVETGYDGTYLSNTKIYNNIIKNKIELETITNIYNVEKTREVNLYLNENESILSPSNIHEVTYENSGISIKENIYRGIFYVVDKDFSKIKYIAYNSHATDFIPIINNKSNTIIDGDKLLTFEDSLDISVKDKSTGLKIDASVVIYGKNNIAIIIPEGIKDVEVSYILLKKYVNKIPTPSNTQLILCDDKELIKIDSVELKNDVKLVYDGNEYDIKPGVNGISSNNNILVKYTVNVVKFLKENNLPLDSKIEISGYVHSHNNMVKVLAGENVIFSGDGYFKYTANTSNNIILDLIVNDDSAGVKILAIKDIKCQVVFDKDTYVNKDYLTNGVSRYIIMENNSVETNSINPVYVISEQVVMKNFFEYNNSVVDMSTKIDRKGYKVYLVNYNGYIKLCIEDTTGKKYIYNIPKYPSLKGGQV